eukprot:6458550-Prymnesium_polylepis.1
MAHIYPSYFTAGRTPGARSNAASKKPGQTSSADAAAAKRAARSGGSPSRGAASAPPAKAGAFGASYLPPPLRSQSLALAGPSSADAAVKLTRKAMLNHRRRCAAAHRARACTLPCSSSPSRHSKANFRLAKLRSPRRRELVVRHTHRVRAPSPGWLSRRAASSPPRPRPPSTWGTGRDSSPWSRRR